MSDTTQATTTTADEENVKRQVAKHHLLGADGKTVDSPEDAHGARYVDIATGQTIDWLYKPGTDAARMMALFGVKTLMTNEASAVRQKDPDGDQVAAINDRLALIYGTDGNGGTWVDRTREGVGAAIDKPQLATAAIEVMLGQGQITEQQKGDVYAKLLKKLEEDKGFVRTVRATDGVNAAYARLVGKAPKSAADLAALLK